MLIISSLSVIGTSSTHQSNTPSNSRSINLHSTRAWHHHGRCFTLRLYLHSTLLYSFLDLVQPNVLHVWFPLLGICHFGYHLFGDYHSIVLFPSVCGGLPLVVAIFPYVWLYSCLSFHLLLPLFCNKAVYKRCALDILILWLYGDYGVLVFPADRFNWLLCLFLVHT